MALKLALRYDKVNTPPGRTQQKYYSLQQQAMLREYGTLVAAKQHGKLQHILDSYDLSNIAYADGHVVPCILMEYAAGGCLQSQLLEWTTAADGKPVAVSKGLSSQDAWEIVGQITVGLADLHSVGVIHLWQLCGCSRC